MNDRRPTTVSLAMNVCQLMHDQGLFVSDLAERTGLSPNTISRIRQGGNISLETLDQVALAFNVHPASLIMEPR